RLDAAAMVRHDHAVDAGGGGDGRVLGGENALKHELDLDLVAQTLDALPGQAGAVRAWHAGHVDAGEIRLAREIVGAAVMAGRALPRVGPPQPREGLPLDRPQNVERDRDDR